MIARLGLASQRGCLRIGGGRRATTKVACMIPTPQSTAGRATYSTKRSPSIATTRRRRKAWLCISGFGLVAAAGITCGVVSLQEQELSPQCPFDPSQASLVTLDDGRTLSYLEYGDPSGRPVICFHGVGSSCFELHAFQMDEFLRENSIRLISIDRPGYGKSTKAPVGYAAVDWAEDVVEFAGALGIDRFSLLASSSASGYVEVCAFFVPRHYPNRLANVAVVSGEIPHGDRHFHDRHCSAHQLVYESSGMSSTWISAKFVDWVPPLASFLLKLMSLSAFSDAEGHLGKLKSHMADEDRKAMDRLPRPMAIVYAQQMGLHGGVHGIMQDLDNLRCKKWGFQMNEIMLERGGTFHVWHGARDQVVPAGVARALSNDINGAVEHVMEEEGHISLFANHWREIVLKVSDSLRE